MARSKGLVAQGASIAVSHSHAISVSFDADTKIIARLAGSFLIDGFLVGQKLETDAAGDNAGPFTITAVGALELTVLETVEDAAAATVNLTAFQRVGEVINFTTPSGTPSEIDMTNLDSEADEFRNSLRDEGSISGEMNFVPSDPGQQILKAMSSEPTPRKVRITLPPYQGNGMNLDGYEWTFDALGRGMPASVATKSRITRSFELRVSGAVDERVLTAGV